MQYGADDMHVGETETLGETESLCDSVRESGLEERPLAQTVLDRGLSERCAFFGGE